MSVLKEQFVSVRVAPGDTKCAHEDGRISDSSLYNKTECFLNDEVLKDISWQLLNCQ